MDRKAFRREFFLNLLVSPVTLVPFVAGVTGLAAGFAVPIWQAAAGGLVLLAGAAGTFVTRFFLQTGKVAQETLAQLERRAQEQNEHQLNAFRERLLEDGDPRNEQMLDELRQLVAAIKSGAQRRQGWVAGMGAHLASEMLPQVQSLFEECLRMLEQTLELWRTARDIHDRSERHQILQRREDLFAEVQRSIGSLTQLIGGIQALGNQPITGTGDTRLQQIREELDRTLEIHRRVREEQRKALNGPSLDEVLGS